jgi:predicted nucleic acid-binding protein
VKLVFDTSALSRLLDGDEELLIAVNSQPYDLVVPFATDAELRYGFANGTKEADNLSRYEQFINQFQVELALPDRDTTTTYAKLATWCRKHGVSLSQNDLWIAAICVQNGGQLLSLDKDFKRLPQVSLVSL